MGPRPTRNDILFPFAFLFEEVITVYTVRKMFFDLRRSTNPTIMRFQGSRILASVTGIAIVVLFVSSCCRGVLEVASLDLPMGIQDSTMLPQKLEILLPPQNASSLVDTDEFKSTRHVDHFVYKPKPPIKQKGKPKPRKQFKNRRLPGKNLFVVNPWVSEGLLEHNSKFIPDDMTIHVYNDTSMSYSVKLIDQELQQVANVTGAWRAYELLRPWAFRADLWRLMVLWSEGGVYLDGKMKLHAPIEQWAALKSDETMALCFDHYKHWKATAGNKKKKPYFWQAILSARRRAPILLEAIKMIIDNVDRRYYPSIKEGYPKTKTYLRILGITGPVLLGSAAIKFPKNTYRAEMKFDWNTLEVEYGEKNILVASVDVSEHQKVHKEGGKPYYELYEEQAIYCDSPKNLNHSDCNLDAILSLPHQIE